MQKDVIVSVIPNWLVNVSVSFSYVFVFVSLSLCLVDYHKYNSHH